MTESSRDHYEVLGVPRHATAPQIQRAFRARAREIHPDVSPTADAAARFRELSAAYAVLHDPVERARYDRLTRGPWTRTASRPMFTSRPRVADVPPTFTSRPRVADVPRFRDEHTIVLGPVVIRLSASFRWLS